MSSVPLICPHCYKSLPGIAAGADGLVRCHACGHAFPPSGGASSGYAPPSFSSSSTVSARTVSPVYQSPPYKGQASYGTAPSGSFSPPYNSTLPVGGKFAPAYPPASGPQNRGSPGMIACGVITGFALLGLLCCGGAGAALYFVDEEQVAQNPGPIPFNPPNNFPPPVIIPPPNMPQRPGPVFPDTLPGMEPVLPVPSFTVPPFPGTPSLTPIVPDPIAPIPSFTVPPPVSIPGVPMPPAERTLNGVLKELAVVDANSLNARELMVSLSMLPVEEARRGEVVDAMLSLLRRAGNRGAALVSGPGTIALEKWASKAEATKLAEFAATSDNHFSRLSVLNVLSRIGGDAETASALLPLFGEIAFGSQLTNVYEKIGAEAEEPVLAGLDSIDRRARRIAFDVLGKIGGEKSKARLLEIMASGDNVNKLWCRKALAEIESRLASAESSDSR